jgi:hypothetical protein
MSTPLATVCGAEGSIFTLQSGAEQEKFAKVLVTPRTGVSLCVRHFKFGLRKRPLKLCGTCIMFKRTAAQAWRFRRLHSHISHTAQAARAQPARSVVIASSAAATAVLLWYSFGTTIHNDAIITPKPEDIYKSVQEAPTSSTGITEGDGSICAVVWGSNQ